MSKAKGKGKASAASAGPGAAPKPKGKASKSAPAPVDTGPTASELKVLAIPQSSTPYAMRVKNGNVPGYIQFAADFLKLHPYRPLAIHTDLEAEGSIHAAPRLITVVEGAKAAFAQVVLARKAQALEVYQYNETGLLASSCEAEPDLARVLSGKTRPKMTHRPFLRITLATHPLADGAVPPNATCQITKLKQPFIRRPKYERRALARRIKEAAEGEAPPPNELVRDAPPHVAATADPKKKRKSDVNDGGESKRRKQ
ncbi:hypothetical protein Q8F55_009043 [Vanrija albida]|uniref:DNA/RNA-binding protein Alba-like domain-containing protein n=1 Tax=Vanrija albida TaxID=181172 RepID=A0ABR3PTF4_9TREE